MLIYLSITNHNSVAVTRSKEVEIFGPPIPSEAVFKKSKEFSDFLLAKSKYFYVIYFYLIFLTQNIILQL